MSTDEELSEIEDDEVIKSSFNAKCVLLQTIKSSTEDYILHIAPKGSGSNKNIAAAFSKDKIDVFKLNCERMDKFCSLDTNANNVDLEFQWSNDNLLYVATDKGTIQVYDVRVDSVVQEFRDTSISGSNFRNLTCLAVSPHNSLICAGTEIFKGDAFILFWDCRKNKFLGGYWESHQDDITQLKFHTEDSNKLISGSTDGLINIYNLLMTREEDALIDSFNTESSVDNLLWFKDKNKDCICCTTHTFDVQLWKSDTADLYESFDRKNLTNSIQRKTEDNCYIASLYRNIHDEAILLVGYDNKKNGCVKSLKINGNKLVPYYLLPENDQIIRCCWTTVEGNLLLTGGEKGILNLWKIS